MARILVCGGRDYGNKDRLFHDLDALNRTLDVLNVGIETVIHGGASGADALAAAWAYHHHIGQMEFKADWDTHGPAAGPIRNQNMLEVGRPDAVVAFPGGRGTEDMMRRAAKAGLPVIKAGGW